jgi:hypothetical protein
MPYPRKAITGSCTDDWDAIISRWHGKKCVKNE